MLIDSVVISLTKNGVGIKPSYSLTIYGHGTLNYYGVENVKVKGKVEEKIERDKIILLLSEFKNSGFFSIPDVYSVDKDAFRSFTTLSISLPISEGKMKTKSLTYYDDETVPYELRKIQMKIDEATDSDKWVKISPVVEPELEEKKEAISFKKEEKKKTSSSKIEEAKKEMDRTQR